jgi:DNA polymerase (family 10)
MGTVSPAMAPALSNRRIANLLFNIATLLDLAQDNIYRVRAYRRAARRILALREEAAAIVARGEELPLPGVGVRIRRKLAELIGSGALAFYDELLEDQPAHLRALLRLDGLGPKLAQRLYEGLGIASPEQLLAAAERGEVRTLFGFGVQREMALAMVARAQLFDATAAAQVA